MNEISTGVLFFTLFILILCSGFFSSSETAMMSLSRYRLKHLMKQGHGGAKLAHKLLQRPDRLIGLILIGNNLVNIFASSLATIIAIRLLGDAGILAATLILTLVILIFAEITPKTYAAIHPEKIAFPASRILQPLMNFIYPVVWLANKASNRLLKIVNIDPTNHESDQLSYEELRSIVGDTGSLVPKRHQDMLLNILDLQKITVNDIMVPRNDVYGIDLDDNDDTIMYKLKTSVHTRLPIYQGDIENTEHMLHLRNTSQFITSQGLDRNKMIGVAKDPFFIPENTNLHDLLLNFQQSQKRIGVVVDEYGVILGIATLEDVLEEIVGEFTSNLGLHDTDIVADDNGYLIKGIVQLRDINKELNWSLPTDGPRTLSGLIIELLEEFPDGNVCYKLNDEYHIETTILGDNMIKEAKLIRLSI